MEWNGTLYTGSTNSYKSFSLMKHQTIIELLKTIYLFFDYCIKIRLSSNKINIEHHIIMNKILVRCNEMKRKMIITIGIFLMLIATMVTASSHSLLEDHSMQEDGYIDLSESPTGDHTNNPPLSPGNSDDGSSGSKIGLP